MLTRPSRSDRINPCRSSARALLLLGTTWALLACSEAAPGAGAPNPSAPPTSPTLSPDAVLTPPANPSSPLVPATSEATAALPSLPSATASGGGSSLPDPPGVSEAPQAPAAGGTTAAPPLPSEPAAGAPAVGDAPGVALDPALLSACTGTSPILCAFDAPNGNYDVTVELGDAQDAGSTWVQAETRRIVLTETTTAPGEIVQFTFTVNVRQEEHDGGQSAPGNVLNLMFGGTAPRLSGVGFAPAPDAVTVFVASDSTAADWEPTNTSALGDDERGWAQELSQYFGRGIAVANYADSGESAGSFYNGFWPAARAELRAGDYVLIQFGHNDQRQDLALYQPALLRYVDDARAAGATPVIISPPGRRTASAANPGFAGLDQQARDLAAENSLALVDLTTLSIDHYASAPDLPALFTTLRTGGTDSTHFSETGASQIAGLVADALRASNIITEP